MAKEKHDNVSDLLPWMQGLDVLIHFAAAGIAAV